MTLRFGYMLVIIYVFIIPEITHLLEPKFKTTL